MNSQWCICNYILLKLSWPNLPELLNCYIYILMACYGVPLKKVYFLKLYLQKKNK